MKIKMKKKRSSNPINKYFSDSATHSVLMSLRHQITMGQLKPGDSLRQEALAKQLGVSRMPVREALVHLHAEALVSFEPQVGFFVRRLSRTEAFGIYELRMLLEGQFLVRHSAWLNARALSNLQDHLQQAEPVEALPAWQWHILNRSFHEQLFSHNNSALTLFTDTIKSLQNRLQPYLFQEKHPTDLRLRLHTEHLRLLAAVRAKEMDIAVRLLKEHLEEERERLLGPPLF